MTSSNSTQSFHDRKMTGPFERNMHIDAAFERGGVWAGVEELAALALRELRTRRRETIIASHSIVLTTILRDRWGVLPAVPITLTDSSEGLERTRNYPLDRAYRIVHGLVDLMNDWYDSQGAESRWRLSVHNAQRAGHLAARFFRELERRGAGFEVALVDDDEASIDQSVFLDAEARASLLASHLSGLEGRNFAAVGDEALTGVSSGAPTDAFEAFYPLILAEQRRRGLVTDAARTALRALCIYNHNGYYHEASIFYDTVVASFDVLVGDDQNLRWNCIGNMFQALAMTVRRHEAKALIDSLAAPHLTDPALLAKMNYVLAMIYLRYSDIPDTELAEDHLGRALKEIEYASDTLSSEDFCFFRVFIGNGIAFLRVRQGRSREALELCRDGHAMLLDVLGEDRHKLHRSVLLYNTAQVFTMLGENDAAIDAYRCAIAIDPNYSEYHNELGNLMQRCERYEEAITCYQRAIAVSAPYSEALFNMTVCLCRIKNLKVAASAIERATALDPDRPEYYVLAAEIAELDVRPGSIRSLLEEALAIEPLYVPALVNMATLLFEEGRFAEALQHVETAAIQEPDQIIHRNNREAIVARIQSEMSNTEANPEQVSTCPTPA